jgi:hypothetical protein
VRTTEKKGYESEKSFFNGREMCSMSYKTYESDKDGRLTIYPALYPPRDKGIFNLFKKLIKIVSHENGKGRLVDRGKPVDSNRRGEFEKRFISTRDINKKIFRVKRGKL